MTRLASRASSWGSVQQFPRSLLLPRIPPPRGLLYFRHSPNTTQSLLRLLLLTRTPLPLWSQFLRSILPTLSKATTSTDLIDHRLQLSKQGPLKSRNQLRHQVILRFERCNSRYSRTDSYRRKQKCLSTIKSVIRAVMKKSQHANHTVTKICEIHTTNYDS